MQRIDDGVLLLDETDHRVMPWKNGGGTTREIFAYGASGADFDWRLSIADVASDGPFSPFDGYARTIMLLEGNGMRLDFSDGSEARVTERFRPVDFDGGTRTFCTLLEGPVRDFNVMSARARVRHEHAVIGTFPFHAAASGMQAIHCLAGSLDVTRDDGTRIAVPHGATLLQLTAHRSVREIDGTRAGIALFVRFLR